MNVFTLFQKRKRVILLLVGVYISCFLILPSFCSAGAAYFKGDDIDDICQIWSKDDSKEKKCNQSVPYLDIQKIVREPIDEEGIVHLTMVIRGEIKQDESIHYIIWYNNSRSKYMMDYSHGVNHGWCRNIEDETLTDELKDPVVTDHTITVRYPLLNESFSKQNIEGRASETTSDYRYIDVVPNVKKGFDPKEINVTDPPDIPGDTSDDANDTPGFAWVGFSIAIFLVYGITRRFFNR